ncbi:MAG TPA: hypothetical protein DDW52_14190 [Planctomycetaceae bacterium]|nr:hypothetical protein [Planctomycetaceae bacterium]
MSEHKELIEVGGPNGAGTTTFAEEYAFLRRLNYADKIAAQHAQFWASVSSIGGSLGTHL